jgi:hypothetical protein
MDNYAKYKIKDYTYWTVYIHENQSYLGRCYVWCHREDARDLPDANKDFKISENVFQKIKEGIVRAIK